MYDLRAVRNDLERRLQQLQTRAHQLEEHWQSVGKEERADWEELAQLRENDGVVDALEDAALEEIASIRRALARLESGEYGNCLICDDAIGVNRLRAIPTASLCLRCAQLEAQGITRGRKTTSLT
ncbi:MAG: TraR/DksA C4-type zinc finger protein [Acidobacteriota bacterium]